MNDLLHERPERTPEQVTEDIRKDLAKHGDIPLVQQVEVKDPFTGEKQIVTIERTGHNEQKLIVALADPNLPRDQKDHILSMYLWERGKESASFLVDLIRSKGVHTKETRAFISQTRFDFEMFADMFVQYLDQQARSMAALMDIDLESEIKGYKEWIEFQLSKVKEGDERPLFTYKDYYYRAGGPQGGVTPIVSPIVVLVDQSIRMLEHAERIQNMQKNIAKARERLKGKGIYIDFQNRPYTIDDPELDDIIKRDRERAAEVEKDD